MEPNQVHLVTAAMLCYLQQVIDAFEPGFPSEVWGDVGDGYRRHRTYDDVALVHSITTSDLYARTLPDANAAFDSPEPDSHAKALVEQHMKPHSKDRRWIKPRNSDTNMRDVESPNKY